MPFADFNKTDKRTQRENEQYTSKILCKAKYSLKLNVFHVYFIIIDILGKYIWKYLSKPVWIFFRHEIFQTKLKKNFCAPNVNESPVSGLWVMLFKPVQFPDSSFAYFTRCDSNAIDSLIKFIDRSCLEKERRRLLISHKECWVQDKSRQLASSKFNFDFHNRCSPFSRSLIPEFYWNAIKRLRL